MSLTDMKIRAAKPGDKILKLHDGFGLQLWVYPNGGKRWRLSYRSAGKQHTKSLGEYPHISLKLAREARESIRVGLRQGVDPLAPAKSAEAESETFASIAAEVIDKKRREAKADRTIEKAEWFLRILAPSLGDRMMRSISAADILAAIRPVEAKGNYETAKRLRGMVGMVFRYAVATGRADNDPTPALRGALTTAKVKHRAAITDPQGFGRLLRMIGGYGGSLEVCYGLELLALLFPRPGELQAMEWSEIDLSKAVWSIPAAKMKMRRDHRTPLPPRAIKLLSALRDTTAGHSKWVFPSERSLDRHISENAWNAALRSMGVLKDEHCAHGFRSSASSILNECKLWSPDAIEAQLAHVDTNAVRRAYQRSDFWDERVRMMDWWDDFCATLRCA